LLCRKGACSAQTRLCALQKQSFLASIEVLSDTSGTLDAGAMMLGRCNTRISVRGFHDLNMMD
jgi:hypothetical protein